MAQNARPFIQDVEKFSITKFLNKGLEDFVFLTTCLHHSSKSLLVFDEFKISISLVSFKLDLF